MSANQQGIIAVTGRLIANVKLHFFYILANTPNLQTPTLQILVQFGYYTKNFQGLMHIPFQECKNENSNCQTMFSILRECLVQFWCFISYGVFSISYVDLFLADSKLS